MKSIPHYIKEALDYNDGNNHTSQFLRSYYKELLKKANDHHIVIQTNEDDGFVEILKEHTK